MENPQVFRITYQNSLRIFYPCRHSSQDFCVPTPGYDWVFRNWIEAEREELFYVDVVASGANLEWARPGKRSELICSVPAFARAVRSPRSVCTLLLALQSAGLLAPEPVNVLSSLWSEVDLQASTRWEAYKSLNNSFLEECQRHDLIATEAILDTITSSLLFPLCGVHLRGLPPNERKKYRKALEQRQNDMEDGEWW